MKNTLLALVTFTAFCSATLLGLAWKTDAVDYERMRAASVEVIIEALGKELGHGSGVITKYGVLTAAHVALGEGEASRILVKFKDGEFVVAHVIRKKYVLGEHSIDTDLALLRIPTSSGYPVADVRCDAVPVGEPVYVADNPGAVRFAITQGHVISDTPRERFAPGRWLQTDAVLAPGNSGGPFYDRDGRVIGITAHMQMMGFGWPTGHGFGNSGPVICDFLENVDG